MSDSLLLDWMIGSLPCRIEEINSGSNERRSLRWGGRKKSDKKGIDRGGGRKKVGKSFEEWTLSIYRDYIERYVVRFHSQIPEYFIFGFKFGLIVIRMAFLSGIYFTMFY